MNTTESESRYRFDVVGGSATDVVAAAGGWLYDRAAAGWDVTVLLRDVGDTRPLEILGVRALELASVLKQWEQRPHPQTIAVCAEMFAGDDRVRDGVRDALEHGGTEVILWGAVPAELDSDVDVRQHRLSAAARVCKAQALMAAGEDPAAATARVELFRRGPAECPSVAADLSPAS